VLLLQSVSVAHSWIAPAACAQTFWDDSTLARKQPCPSLVLQLPSLVQKTGHVLALAHALPYDAP
jgi:hypothetical protein